MNYSGLVYRLELYSYGFTAIHIRQNLSFPSDRLREYCFSVVRPSVRTNLFSYGLVQGITPAIIDGFQHNSEQFSIMSRCAIFNICSDKFNSKGHILRLNFELVEKKNIIGGGCHVSEITCF